MPISIATGISAADLTVEHFEAFPVWEFASEEESAQGQDETWVRPVEGRLISPGNGTFLVLAAIAAPSGREYKGYVELMGPGTEFCTCLAGHLLGSLPDERIGAPYRFRLTVLVSGEETPLEFTESELQ